MSNNDQGWPPQGQGRPDQPNQGQPGYGQQGQQGGPAGAPYGQGSYGTPREERGGFRESWREEEFGHGQERYYGNVQQPTPIDQASPPSGPIGMPKNGSGSKRTSMIAAGAVTAVVVLGGGAFGVYKSTQDDNKVAGGGSSTSATAPATPTATSSAPTSSAPSTAPTTQSGKVGTPARASVPPLTPGYQVNQGDPKKVDAAYDVPPVTETFDVGTVKKPIWDVRSVTTFAGYTDSEGKALAVGTAPTYYRMGYCPGASSNTLGMIVWLNTGVRDPAEVNPEASKKWTDAVATKKDNTVEKYTPGTPKQVTVNRGQTPAVQTRTTATITEQDPKKCTPPKVEVIVTSFSAPTYTATIMIARDLGVPNAMSDADVDKILASARPTT